MISGLIGMILSWIDDVLHIEYITFGVILLISIFIGLFFWYKFGKKWGKTKTYIYSMTYLAAVMPLMGLISIGIIPIPVFWQAVAFGILGAVGLAGYYLLPYAIVADIVEQDEKKTQESRAGVYYGFEAIPLNFFQFIGYFLIGLLLDARFWNLFNISGTFTSSFGTTFSLGYVVFGPLASVFILLSVLVFWKKVNADPLSKNTTISF